MTKAEFLQLAAQRYDALRDLDRHDNFYDYEKEFEQIMLGLSRDVLEKNLGEPPENRRKKSIRTRLGSVVIANAHRFMPRGRFRISQYMVFPRKRRGGS